jgi:DsbE subfamily thiol:disulfide oxidoreductase
MKVALPSAPAGARRNPSTALLVTSIVMMAVAGLLFLFAYQLANQARGGGLGAQSLTRSPARNFTISRLGGGTIDLASLKGRPVLVNFWASWCVPCREEASTLERAWQTYEPRGVAFVGINIWDSETTASDFTNQFGLTYPNGVDADGKVAIDYGVRGVPETFFIDRQGMLVSKYVGPVLNNGSGLPQLGAMDQQYLTHTLDGLLSGAR